MSSPATVGSSGASKKKKKGANKGSSEQQLNGVNNNGTSSSSSSIDSKAAKLTEKAESKAADAVVGIVEAQEAATNGNYPAGTTTATQSAAERILTKRVKATTKKLQRIAQYEALDPTKLNEDQRTVIASKNAVQAALKELQEVAKGWEQAEREAKAEQEAVSAQRAEVEKRNGEAAGDESLLLFQQILRLFTLLHLPQITPSFAPTQPEFLSEVTSQESAAIGKLYQDLVEQPLYSGAEVGQSEEGSVKESLRLVTEGDKKEIIPGVSYQRLQQLVTLLTAPRASSDPVAESPAAPPAEDIEAAKVPRADESAPSQAQEAVEVAPELVQPPTSTSPAATTSTPAAVNGISFFQPSDVGSEPAVSTSNGPDEAAAGLEPEGGAVDSAPTLQGETSTLGQEAAKGTVLGETPATAAEVAPPPAAEPVKPKEKKFDWANDDDDDDLGDPLDAFPDTRTRNSTAAASPQLPSGAELPATEPIPDKSVTDAQAAAAAPSSTPADQATTSTGADVPATSVPVETTSAAPAPVSTQQNRSLQPKQKPQQQQQQTSTPPAPKKGPIVDEDGFVTQVSKRTLHQQQQQQQQQQASRGRGGARGGARGGRGGGAIRGGGEFRGGGRGRGGAKGSGPKVATAPGP